MNSFIVLVRFSLALIFIESGNVYAMERPFIWMSAAEKFQILDKIENNDWAKKRFEILKQRTDDFAPTSLKERIENINQLPLQWGDKNNSFPRFIAQKNIGNNHLREPLQISLQAAIDCGILFNLTGQSQYAECAADILYTVVKGLNSTPVGQEKVIHDNRGWIVPENHLLEARIYGAQIPLIYDFIYNYVKAGGKVYDAHLQQLVSFDFDAAQRVFATYAQLALDSGLVDNNWPILESTSLVHNALAIDDELLRNRYLQHYLTIDTPNHDSLAKIAKSYATPGDIWPESLGYSMHVGYFSLYLMTLIDRIEPSLKLGNKYPNITTALLTYEQLRFPNGDYPAFGDSHRSHENNYFEFELAYKLALLNNNQELKDIFANEIKQAIEVQKYDRSTLKDRHGSAKPYYAPLELLWSVADLGKGKSHETFSAFPTVDLPFAGLFIQRNLTTQDKVKNSLMATIGGAAYVHGHASGIDMELYGQGHVLGIEAGKGDYPTNVHQNYNRLFAGHNTVISNGASATKGNWISLGINRVENVVMEPEVRKDPVSDKYSFVTASFFDEHNLVKEAHHQRTTAVIRLTDTKGYYLDVFRAKSDTPDQFHDYLYRNVADDLAISSQGKELQLEVDNDRFQPADPSMLKKWGQDRNFAHPGWHFLKDVNTSKVTNQAIKATFKADKFNNSPVMMQANVVPGLELSMTTATTPAVKSEDPPYKKKNLPIMVLRHQGETWQNPFALTYESYQGDEKPVIQSTQRIMQGNIFKGVKVVANVDGNIVEQYILIQEKEADEFHDPLTGIAFIGRLGIVTLNNGKISDLYIGSGSKLIFQRKNLAAKSAANSAYKQF
ncbi:MAG: heparinase II/III family protein [Paraglaciecola sp.]|nr:heparinase II/III family protein [Paraglaciecola sp.]